MLPGTWELGDLDAWEDNVARNGSARCIQTLARPGGSAQRCKVDQVPKTLSSQVPTLRHEQISFPHPLVLIVGFIILAALLSYVLPAGEFTRHLDPATGRQVVVAGSYHAVPAAPVGLLDVLVDVPKGLADAGAVVFLIFLAGGAFTVVDQTGALRFGWTGCCAGPTAARCS